MLAPCLHGLGLFDVAVFESEEIEHAVEAQTVDALPGTGLHARLGVEGNAQSGLGDHRQVVGSVAHGDRLREVDFLYLCDELEQFCFALAVDYVTDIMSGEFPVFAYLQLVGIDIVDAELAL